MQDDEYFTDCSHAAIPMQVRFDRNLLSAALEIHLHLEDGRVTRFAQHDEAIARMIMHQIHPGKLFDLGALVLGDKEAVVAFQPSNVVRVDFVTDIDPHWPLPQNLLDIQEITRDDFRERYCPENDNHGLPDWMPFHLHHAHFAEVELVNGALVWMQAHIRAEMRFPMDLSMMLQHIFSARGLYAKRHRGGLMVLNHASIARLTFYPGMHQVMPGVWQATCITP
jgi:hypothetical protein